MTPVTYVHEDQFCVVRNDSQGPSTTGVDKKRPPCRYYRSGNCRRGSNCPFAHSSAPTQAETLTISHPAYQAELPYDLPYAYALGQPPVYHLSGSQAQPIFLWQPYPPLSPSFDPRYGLARQAEPLFDYPDDKSDPSTVESSSSMTSLDHRVRMTLDTTRSECVQSGAIQRTASPPGDVGINSPPDYPACLRPILSGVKSGRERATSSPYLDPTSTAAQSSSRSLPWQDDTRKRPLAYKTKLCKFYAANGKCTSGEKCTFIHDPESKGNADTPSTELAPPMDAKLPPKPRDKYEEYRARDFYPISWRVIGGGVMMGGKRQICPAFATGHCKYGDDCKLAHETELETDPVGFIKLMNEDVRKGEVPASPRIKDTPSKRARSGPQKPKSIKVPSAVTEQAVHFPSTTQAQRPDAPPQESPEAAKKKGEGLTVPTSPGHRRTQSMSMIFTSPPLDTAQSNFAAEL